ITTITLLKACLFREESRGGHYRDDFPDKDKTWECHTRQQSDQKIHEERVCHVQLVISANSGWSEDNDPVGSSGDGRHHDGCCDSPNSQSLQ
ncbi:MAG: hypothetical protein VXW11_03405, partial [Pseudomonadota bacterium]|nr:hypothetical protein [Pseudomonadota bacterium]